jgi:hypothetical protein
MKPGKTRPLRVTGSQLAVIVVGTSHSIQLGSSTLDSQTFREFLEELCGAQGVRAVAEELNHEALCERECTASIPMQTAASLRLQHCLCDPDRSQRAQLGICQENDIRAQGFLGNWSKAEISRAILVENAKRERYWLEQLRSLNVWPVLFVCGANHAGSFKTLLNREGLLAHVAAKDWASNHRIDADARRRGARG